MKKDLLISIGIALILVIIVDLYKTETVYDDHKISFDTQSIVPEIPKKFGIPLPDYQIISGTIEAGMYLGKLFQMFGIENTDLSNVLEKSKPVFDVRKVKRGNNYHAFLSKDSTEQLNYLVYEINRVDYVVFNFKDSTGVYKEQKPIKTVKKEIGGIVNGALWFALRDIGANPLLANELSEVYAWSVDFFALQKGDKFKVLYEEKTVEGETIGAGNIEAAFFEHNGEKIYAIPFKQDSSLSFYNTDGESLKKAFLKAPLKFSRISSGFSNARMHPILKIVRPHHGVDYGAPSGTPVYALGDGTVIHAAYTGGAGHYVKIRHNSVYTTGYMHLRAYAKGIRAGKRVKQGELIGYVGSTGLSTGPHLDFRVWKNGRAVNPLKIDSPPVEPVKEEYLDAFNKIAEKYKSRLDSIPYSMPVSENEEKLIAEK
jgi:murein DD-endopeptidase MepM/ murein hydrolase activator NlpD